jgi:bacterioferritin
MRGDDEVIARLNEQLTRELTAINQYFLHAKMQANWGFTKLAEHTRDESIDEMKHAERITDRILFLEGLPNYQKLLPLRIGQTVKEQFEADLAVEMEAVDALRPAIALCREKGDITTANIFEDILEDEEEHIDYLETNLELIGKLGEQLYLSQLVERPPTNG